jgi:bleomycin hydrolase
MKVTFCIVYLTAFTSFINAQDISVKNLGLTIQITTNCTAVKDQFMSGTCWSFASLSFLESEIIRLKKKQVDLSEMFIARYSYIRKIETHLQKKGSNYFTPGGQFHDVMWVLKNYGAIPESMYSGKTKGKKVHNHALLDTTIDHYVKQLVKQNITKLSNENRIYIDSVLDEHLGFVPADFDVEGVSYTPQTYLANYLKFNINNYIEITSYTHHPFFTSFILEDKYNWTSDKYYNLPIEDVISITNSVLKKGNTVGWDGDVDDSTFLYEKGLAYLPMEITNYQQERQFTFTDSTTDIDHLMHIVAIVKDKNAQDWYYVKNSWGNYSNNLKGFLFMSKDYFVIKTSAIIINKNDLPQAIRKKLKL